jgi:ubiquinone/menaquinone biosynthesis C-methylase UbiE
MMGKAFDRIAPHYDRWIGKLMSGRLDRMAEILSCSSEEVILDLGGGTGLFSRRIANRCKAVHLLDESLRMIEQVPPGKIHTRLGDATETGYPDRYFDAVVLSDVFHHVREQDLLLGEITRLLKPKGRLLVNEIDLDRFWGRAVACGENLFFSRISPTGFRAFSELLEKRGFSLLEKARDSWSFIGLWRFRGDSPGLLQVPQAELPEDIDRFQVQGNQGHQQMVQEIRRLVTRCILVPKGDRKGGFDSLFADLLGDSRRAFG